MKHNMVLSHDSDRDSTMEPAKSTRYRAYIAPKTYLTKLDTLVHSIRM